MSPLAPAGCIARAWREGSWDGVQLILGSSCTWVRLTLVESLFVFASRVEPDGSHLKCRFTPLSVGNHTFIGKSCVVESAGIGCNVRIDDGCVLVSCCTRRHDL